MMSCVVVSRCDLALWSRVVVSRCGPTSWSSVAILRRGLASWMSSCVVDVVARCRCYLALGSLSCVMVMDGEDSDGEGMDGEDMD